MTEALGKLLSEMREITRPSLHLPSGIRNRYLGHQAPRNFRCDGHICANRKNAGTMEAATAAPYSGLPRTISQQGIEDVFGPGAIFGAQVLYLKQRFSRSTELFEVRFPGPWAGSHRSFRPVASLRRSVKSENAGRLDRKQDQWLPSFADQGWSQRARTATFQEVPSEVRGPHQGGNTTINSCLRQLVVESGSV